VNNFSFVLTSKWLILLFAWVVSLAVSFGLRVWGIEHPEPFAISPFLVFFLLFGPSLFLGIWLIYFGFRDNSSD
jgi:hypothetical protein